MSRQRYFRYDLIRVFAALLVYFFHFSMEWMSYGNPSARGLLLFGANLTLGQIGVVLFFMLSGLLAAKSFESKNASSMTLRSYLQLTVRYYRRRLLSILPVYWVCWLFMNGCFSLAAAHGLRDHQFRISRHIIHTVLGLDGYLTMSGIPTQYLIGEWFVGAILILYALFPVLYRLIRRFPKLSFICLVLLQAFLLTRPQGTRLPETLVQYRILDFSVGIGLGILAEDRLTAGRVCAGAAAGLLVLLGIPIPASPLLIITPSGLCAMLLLLSAGKKAEQCTRSWFRRMRTALVFFSACSFPFFLLHHQLLLFAMDFGASYVKGTGSFLLLCLITFFVILLFAFLLQRLTKALLKLFYPAG